MQPEPTHSNKKDPNGLKSWLWFIGLWAGGVAAVSILGLSIKWAIG